MPRATPSFRLVLLLPALAAATAGLTGCLYAGGRTVREIGPQIGESTVKAIEPGKTGADWLIASFGPPTSRATASDGAEIFRYDSERRTTNGAYFLAMIASSDNTIERTSWWFEVRNGIVQSYWGERCDPVCVNILNPERPADPPAAPAAP
jgi:hypothetical protein